MGTLTNYSFFSGGGGLEMGSRLAGGIRTVGYCEFDRYAQGVLRSRIKDGGLDDGPIWTDIKTFDGKPWFGVDIVSGGFPCQDVSVAGKKKGITKETRSGLFYQICRIRREMGPGILLLENVAGLLVYPGAHRVFGELAAMGYDAGWKIISASQVGACHRRERIFIVAYPNSEWKLQQKRTKQNKRGRVSNSGKKMADTVSKRRFWWTGLEAGEGTGRRKGSQTDDGNPGVNEFKKRRSETGISGREIETNWTFEPDVGRVANVVAFRTHRLRLLGNGVVPEQSVPAWEEVKRLSHLF